MSDSTQDSEQPTFLLLTADLFLGSRLKAIGEQAGYSVVTAPRPQQALELLAKSPHRVLIDLTMPGLDLASVIEHAGTGAAERVAAYPQHVRIDLLKAARAAGLKAVFTRSQLE